MNDYGLIVIGGGMAGLSTALTWLKTPKYQKEKVLLLEKEPHLGGCVTSFSRKGYRFDTVQIIPDISKLEGYLKLNLNLQPYDDVYARLFLANPHTKKAEIFKVPSSRGSFESYLSALFPEEKENIHRFFSYGQSLLDEVPWLLTEPGILGGLSILWNCRKILRRSNQSYRRYLDSFGFKRQELIEVLDIFSSFSGLSGDRCAALLTACATMKTLQGSYRPTGGFIQFPHQLGKAIKELGGTIRCNSSVDEILVENNQIRGVRCGKEIYKSSRVVCTADTFVTAEKLLPMEAKYKGRKYWKKIQKSEVSPSSFTIHLGLKEGLDLKEMGFACGYNVLTTGRDSHEEAYRLWKQGELLQKEDSFHMAVISPSAAVGGKPTLIIHVTPAPLSDWKVLRNKDYSLYENRKNKLAQWYIQKVDQYMIPQLREYIDYMDVATPATYERYLGSTQGANNDMLALPNNFGKNRLPPRTPIEGLIIPKFSHGIWPSLQAGLQAVDLLSHGEVLGGKASL